MRGRYKVGVNGKSAKTLTVQYRQPSGNVKGVAKIEVYRDVKALPVHTFKVHRISAMALESAGSVKRGKEPVFQLNIEVGDGAKYCIRSAAGQDVRVLHAMLVLERGSGQGGE